MICHACLAFNPTKTHRDGVECFHCRQCGSYYTYSQAQAPAITRPHPGAFTIHDATQLTNEPFKAAMKKLKPKPGDALFVCTPEGATLDADAARVNLMTANGARIFFARHGWAIERIIDNEVTKYTYGGTTENI